jgi:hypothetical protein
VSPAPAAADGPVVSGQLGSHATPGWRQYADPTYNVFFYSEEDLGITLASGWESLYPSGAAKVDGSGFYFFALNRSTGQAAVLTYDASGQIVSTDIINGFSNDGAQPLRKLTGLATLGSNSSEAASTWLYFTHDTANANGVWSITLQNTTQQVEQRGSQLVQGFTFSSRDVRADAVSANVYADVLNSNGIVVGSVVAARTATGIDPASIQVTPATTSQANLLDVITMQSMAQAMARLEADKQAVLSADGGQKFILVSDYDDLTDTLSETAAYVPGSYRCGSGPINARDTSTFGCPAPGQYREMTYMKRFFVSNGMTLDLPLSLPNPALTVAGDTTYASAGTIAAGSSLDALIGTYNVSDFDRDGDVDLNDMGAEGWTITLHAAVYEGAWYIAPSYVLAPPSPATTTELAVNGGLSPQVLVSMPKRTSPFVSTTTQTTRNTTRAYGYGFSLSCCGFGYGGYGCGSDVPSTSTTVAGAVKDWLPSSIGRPKADPNASADALFQVKIRAHENVVYVDNDGNPISGDAGSYLTDQLKEIDGLLGDDFTVTITDGGNSVVVRWTDENGNPQEKVIDAPDGYTFTNVGQDDGVAILTDPSGTTTIVLTPENPPTPPTEPPTSPTPSQPVPPTEPTPSQNTPAPDQPTHEDFVYVDRDGNTVVVEGPTIEDGAFGTPGTPGIPGYVGDDFTVVINDGGDSATVTYPDPNNPGQNITVVIPAPPGYEFVDVTTDPSPNNPNDGYFTDPSSDTVFVLQPETPTNPPASPTPTPSNPTSPPSQPTEPTPSETPTNPPASPTPSPTPSNPASPTPTPSPTPSQPAQEITDELVAYRMADGSQVPADVANALFTQTPRLGDGTLGFTGIEGENFTVTLNDNDDDETNGAPSVTITWTDANGVPQSREIQAPAGYHFVNPVDDGSIEGFIFERPADRTTIFLAKDNVPQQPTAEFIRYVNAKTGEEMNPADYTGSLSETPNLGDILWGIAGYEGNDFTFTVSPDGKELTVSWVGPLSEADQAIEQRTVTVPAPDGYVFGAPDSGESGPVFTVPAGTTVIPLIPDATQENFAYEGPEGPMNPADFPATVNGTPIEGGLEQIFGEIGDNFTVTVSPDGKSAVVSYPDPETGQTTTIVVTPPDGYTFTPTVDRGPDGQSVFLRPADTTTFTVTKDLPPLPQRANEEILFQLETGEWLNPALFPGSLDQTPRLGNDLWGISGLKDQPFTATVSEDGTYATLTWNQPVIDAEGNPVRNPDGTWQTEERSVTIPAPEGYLYSPVIDDNNDGTIFEIPRDRTIFTLIKQEPPAQPTHEDFTYVDTDGNPVVVEGPTVENPDFATPGTPGIPGYVGDDFTVVINDGGDSATVTYPDPDNPGENVTVVIPAPPGYDFVEVNTDPSPNNPNDGYFTDPSSETQFVLQPEPPAQVSTEENFAYEGPDGPMNPADFPATVDGRPVDGGLTVIPGYVGDNFTVTFGDDPTTVLVTYPDPNAPGQTITVEVKAPDGYQFTTIDRGPDGQSEFLLPPDTTTLTVEPITPPVQVTDEKIVYVGPNGQQMDPSDFLNSLGVTPRDADGGAWGLSGLEDQPFTVTLSEDGSSLVITWTPADSTEQRSVTVPAPAGYLFDTVTYGEDGNNLFIVPGDTTTITLKNAPAQEVVVYRVDSMDGQILNPADFLDSLGLTPQDAANGAYGMAGFLNQPFTVEVADDGASVTIRWTDSNGASRMQTIPAPEGYAFMTVVNFGPDGRAVMVDKYGTNTANGTTTILLTKKATPAQEYIAYVDEAGNVINPANFNGLVGATPALVSNPGANYGQVDVSDFGLNGVEGANFVVTLDPEGKTVAFQWTTSAGQTLSRTITAPAGYKFTKVQSKTDEAFTFAVPTDTTLITLVPDKQPPLKVAMRKTSDPVTTSQVEANQEITYTVTFTNNEGSQVVRAEIWDNLLRSDWTYPAGHYGVLEYADLIESSITTASGSAIFTHEEGSNDPIILWTTGAVAPGQSVTVSYTVKVHADVPGNVALDNRIWGNAYRVAQTQSAELPMLRAGSAPAEETFAAIDCDARDSECVTTHYVDETPIEEEVEYPSFVVDPTPTAPAAEEPAEAAPAATGGWFSSWLTSLGSSLSKVIR